MRNQHRRKTPRQHAKRDTTQSPGPLRKPDAAWLPNDNAGFAAWISAAERASQEYRDAWNNVKGHRGDKKLEQVLEDSCRLMAITAERAYPPGFWEGIDDLNAGKSDHLEIYIAFLEADAYFFGSGYTKAKIIRYLKWLPLTRLQQRRLQEVILRVTDKGFRREFRSYCRLARHVQSDDWLREVEARLESNDPNHALRAQWILDACLKK